MAEGCRKCSCKLRSCAYTRHGSRVQGRRKTTDAGGTAVGAVAAAAALTKHSKVQARGPPPGCAAAVPAAACDQMSSVQDKGVPDFYRWQKRENRRTELMELQKSFESDQQRIAELRKARRFKPY